MANCIYCGAETSSYRSERPVCVKCAEGMDSAEAMDPKQAPPKQAPLDNDYIRRILQVEVAETNAQAEAAAAEFKAIMSSGPTGIPHPDGTQRIHQAARVEVAIRVPGLLQFCRGKIRQRICSGRIPSQYRPCFWGH